MQWLLFATALFIAFSNGANDNFKGFATVWGSNTLSYRRALALATLATRIPQIQKELFRRLSKDIGDASQRIQESTADERLAAFILNLCARYEARGFAANALRLSMPRSDIANYLGLAAETVSRVLRRFQDSGLLVVEGREVSLKNPAGLREVARNILPDYRAGSN